MGTTLKLCFRAVLFILREIRLNNRWSQGLIMISAIRYRIYDIKMQGSILGLLIAVTVAKNSHFNLAKIKTQSVVA